MTEAATSIDHAPLLERAFAFVPEEAAYEIRDVEGEIPAYVRGSYYLNGPARFARGELSYRHWLDGDGMVSALHFRDGSVRFVNRFVRSHKLLREEELGRAVYRTFGTSFAGDELVRGIALASPVNVSVYPFAGTLLAFGEQGLPWELDPESLETRGEYTFGGRLNAISPFSAHPHIDAESGELFNFGVSFSATRPLLQLYRFDAAGELVYRQRLPLDAPRSIHDFGISQGYVVVYASPYVLDMGRFATGGATIMESLSWEPERGSRLLIASRDTGELEASVDLGSRYCLHLANCFEADGRLHVDVVELERPVYDQYEPVPDFFTEVAEGWPVRYVVDPARWQVVERREIDYRKAPDFPSIDPRLVGRPYDCFWMLGISQTGKRGRKFFDQLVHLDWSLGGVAGLWQAPPRSYLGGEPAFVPGASDGSGAVVCQLFDAAERRASFLLFDAFDLPRGPIATLPLESPLPPCFHAVFAPA